MSLWRMILTAINLVGLRFGGAAIGLFSQILLARLLPQAEVGIIMMALSVAAIVSLVMTAGYPSLTMTVLPRYYALGRKTLSDVFHRAVWRDSLIVSLVIAALAAAAYLWLPLEPGLRSALLFGCFMAPASSLIRITSSVANSRRRFSLSYVPDFLFRPGLVLLFLVTMWLLGLPISLWMVLWVMVIVTAAVAVAQAWILGRDALPATLRTARHELAPYLRNRAISLVLVAAVAASFADLVTLIGGFFLPASEVAELGVAIRLAALAGFVTQATQSFVLPDLTAAITRGDRGATQSLLIRINFISMTAIAACVAGAVVFGPLMLSVFGEKYTDAHWPMVLFMISQLFRAAGGMNQHLLSIDGFQMRSAGSCVLSVVVLAVMSVVLTPVMGVIGLAFAAILADAVWALALGHQAERYAGYRGDLLAVLRFHRQSGD